MATDLNVAPYYDDFNEEKNFHKILFKPGVPVQARELTQSQSILQNQVKRIGDFLFTEGDLVQGSSPLVNTSAKTIRVKDVDSRGVAINHSEYIGLFVRTSDENSPVGVVEFTFGKDDPNLGDPISFVITLRKYSATEDDTLEKTIFSQETELLFYEDYIDCLNLNTNIKARATTVRDLVRNAISTLSAFSKEVTLSNPSTSIEVGDLLIHPSITKKIYVTEVISPLQIVISESPDVNISAELVQYTKRCGNPTSILTQDTSIFYKFGYFVRCESQSIVPDKNTMFPSRIIGLYSEQQIITSNDDLSLLDPALESSNYFASGADRLKIDLTITSLTLNENGNAETPDDFISLVKFNRGSLEFVKTTDLRSAFDERLAERTYDESGNYVVDNFTIIPQESTSGSNTLNLKISPGKAYVGGYAVKTLGTSELSIPKSDITRTDELYNVNTTRGNYIKITDVQGSLPKPQQLVQSEGFLELHRMIDGSGGVIDSYPANANTRVGIVSVKGLEYDGYYTGNLVHKLYSQYIALQTDTPISWSDWADTYNITDLEEAQYLASQLFGVSGEGTKLLGNASVGFGVVSVYDLYREPDSAALAFLYIIYLQEGKEISTRFLSRFYSYVESGRVTSYPLDAARISQSSKAFVTNNNQSPFFDGAVNTNKVTHIVGVSNEYTNHGTAATYASPFFKAKVHSSGRDVNNRLIVFDKKPSDRLIFPTNKKYVKEISNVRTSYTKVFRTISFTSGRYTLTVSSPEFFPIGDGSVPPSTARANFILVIKSGQTGSVPLGAWDFEDGTVSITGDSASLIIDTGDASFTGTADLQVTLENDNLTKRTKTLVEYQNKLLNIDTTGKDYSLEKSDIYKFRGIYSIDDLSLYQGSWNSSNSYTSNQIVINKGQAFRALTPTSGVETSFANAWEVIQTENLTNYILDNGQRDSLYDHGFVKFAGSQASVPGNVIVSFDYFTHSGEGPIVVQSYDANLFTRIPIYKSTIDGTEFNLRDCIDFRPRRQDDSDYYNTQISVFPTSTVNTEVDIEYYIGRKDRIYVTNGLQNYGSPFSRFYHVQGKESANPVEPIDESDLTKLSLCVLDIPPFAVSAFDITFKYDDNNRYTMKDIGNLNDSIIKLERAVKLQSIEVQALKSIILNDSGEILLKSGIFVEDFSSLEKADIAGGYFSAIVDTGSKECYPSFSAYNIDLEIPDELSNPDINVVKDLITVRYDEETFIYSISSDGSWINPNSGKLDNGRGRAKLSKKNSLTVNSLLSGSSILSSSIDQKTIDEYITASQVIPQSASLLSTSDITLSKGAAANYVAYLGESALAIAWLGTDQLNLNFNDSVIALDSISRLLSGPGQYVSDASSFVYQSMARTFSVVIPSLAGAGKSTADNLFTNNTITSDAENFVQFADKITLINRVLGNVTRGSYGSGLAGTQAGLSALNVALNSGAFISEVARANSKGFSVAGGTFSFTSAPISDFYPDINRVISYTVISINSIASLINDGTFNNLRFIYSDIRLKSKIKYIKTLDNGLNLYEFEYIDKLKNILGKGKYIGYIAQEVEKLYPNSVIHDSLGYKMINYFSIGN